MSVKKDYFILFFSIDKIRQIKQTNKILKLKTRKPNEISTRPSINTTNSRMKNRAKTISLEERKICEKERVAKLTSFPLGVYFGEVLVKLTSSTWANFNLFWEIFDKSLILPFLLQTETLLFIRTIVHRNLTEAAIMTFFLFLHQNFHWKSNLFVF